MPTIELLHRLDQQLPNIDTTHHLDLRLTLNPPPRLHEIAAAFENYIAKFGLDRDERSRSRDSIKERFQIARGEQPLAEFGRSVDPIWDPIRNRPDFQQLVSGPEQIGPNK